jgi:hypothetical protein
MTLGVAYWWRRTALGGVPSLCARSGARSLAFETAESPNWFGLPSFGFLGEDASKNRLSEIIHIEEARPILKIMKSRLNHHQEHNHCRTCPAVPLQEIVCHIRYKVI